MIFDVESLDIQILRQDGLQMLCVTNLPPCLFDHTPPGVFDGQGSGHDFYGTMWNPPSGFVSGMDGDRAGHFNCDYRQA
ncbi:hypothetical protein GUITHDRAFT_155978 [Guillardia theta CCMP2712]|uniref:Uncharacterized protein n=1 Tax=Guillardia theta (strain CCMP2712) TaxID=905079 RepID=L1IBG4_GUITC|nr:hypothetical protein GUITHDRAFT_155978 [Guillardia theta CCMP2712]EKX33601.1 hypothetical protein GUITHDRAFT_155978 [Guillardia theta CCMP2712]|eukprot:XP_005820581.1 hypothetical protein GUITHDRAFT_155978 [Guillardia theta CCMP2712]